MTDSSSSPSIPATPGSRNRRGWLAAVALATGTGLAGWWLWRRPAVPQTGPKATPETAATAVPAEDTAVSGAPYPDLLPEHFWAQAFPTPNGRPLLLNQFKGRPLLINFWATWCPPCVKELPLLDDFAHRMRPQGWQVLGLAADQPEAVQAFLQRTPVGYAMAMTGMPGIDLARQLGNDSGGLPFTVLVDAQGRVKARRMGAVREADLAEWARLTGTSKAAPTNTPRQS